MSNKLPNKLNILDNFFIEFRYYFRYDLLRRMVIYFAQF